MGNGAKEIGSKGDTKEIKMKPIQSHAQPEVYQLAFEAAMKIFELTKQFPVEERYSLTDQSKFFEFID